MRRSTILVAMLCCGLAPSLRSQAIGHRSSVIGTENRRLTTDDQRASFQRAVVHTGKWLTAASVGALIVFAEKQHTNSRREWNALLDVCRSAQDACALGTDGRYIRSDAEQLYQRSRAYDRRANRWLLGAQASLLATTALFIIDLHPGEGPGNIPFAPMQVGVRVPF
ncbi:MAG TPA: hypothetical protein VNJ06_06085 [Gemmatimonadales bacterium]|nr:hypothetical protein [Gemmatimonadales bacterium]